jgi:hypothetical protein
MTPSVRHVTLAAQLALLGGLLLVSGIMAARRLVDGPTVPLSATWLAATGIAFAATCAAARLIGLPWPSLVGSRWRGQAARFVPLGACGLLVAGVLLPGTALAGGCLLVALLAVEETWCLARLPGGRALPRDGVGSRFRDLDGRGLAKVSEVTRSTPDPFASDRFASVDDETVDQQIARRRTPDGEETIEGFVRVHFGAGQRTAESHIAFCPPLERRPRVEFEAAAGPDARIELGQVLPLGIRLDLKLAQATAEPTAVVVHFAAVPESSTAGSGRSNAAADDTIARRR